MLQIIICICAIYGLAFVLKETSGPWGILSIIRNRLIANKYVGLFFFNLFECYFCVGFHAGWIVYLLSQHHWHLNFLILWGLAGGVISLIIDGILSRPVPPQ